MPTYYEYPFHKTDCYAGEGLISKLCSIAKETGCGRIDWIVARDNESGRGFYNSIGATIFEEVRHSRLDESAINKLADNT